MSQFIPNLSQQQRTAAVAAVAVLPVVLPTLYVAYLNWAVRRITTCTSSHLPPPATTTSNTPPPPRTPKSLPKEVAANPDDWVVCYERVVSLPIPASSLTHKLVHGTAGDSPSPLLTAYLRTTYRAFSWTPQAFLIRGMLTEPERKGSFDGAYIAGLRFARGDVVDGVYSVASYETAGEGKEVIELSIDVPQSYKGPPVRGLILSAVEEEGEDSAMVRFVNETWLWRKRDEKPTLLETAFGRWFHSLLAGWLVMKGLGGVTRK